MSIAAGGGGSSNPVPPVFIGEQRLFAGLGRHKRLAGFRLRFNAPLDAGLAQSIGNFRVTQARGRITRVLPLRSAGYNPGDDSVTISVAGFKAKKAGLVAITGLAGANGAPMAPIVTRL
jgi:hypothetical protein